MTLILIAVSLGTAAVTSLVVAAHMLGNARGWHQGATDYREFLEPSYQQWFRERRELEAEAQKLRDMPDGKGSGGVQ